MPQGRHHREEPFAPTQRHRPAHISSGLRAVALGGVLALGLAQSACVVEEVRPISPFETIARSNRDGDGAGPMRTGNATQIRITRGGIALLPLGRVRYDGVTLPLTSPNGRWLVAQEGDAPQWSTILAVPFVADAHAAPDSNGDDRIAPASPTPGIQRLRVYRVFDDRIEPQTVVQNLSPGTILGRSCNDEGFLVERPMEDGSRWIGMIRWADATGAAAAHTSWLVADEHLNAHATLGPSGASNGPELAWSRKRLGSDRFELVYRPAALDRRGELRASIDGAHVVFPLFFGAHCAIGPATASNAAPSGVWAMVLPVAEQHGQSSSLDLAEFVPAHTSLHAVQRLPVATGTDMLSAYQAVASAQSPAACGSCRGIMVYSAGADGMIYVPSRSATSTHPTHEPIVLLDSGTFAAIPFGTAPQSESPNLCVPASALCMSPEGLIEVPLAASVQGHRRERIAREDDTPVEFTPVPVQVPSPVPVRGTLLLPGSFVPRTTTYADGRLLLLAPPIKGEDFVLELHLAARAEPLADPSRPRSGGR